MRLLEKSIIRYTCLRFTQASSWRIVINYLPIQLELLRTNPCLHVQLKLPTVFEQSEFSGQGLILIEHSSLSKTDKRIDLVCVSVTVQQLMLARISVRDCQGTTVFWANKTYSP